MKICSKCGAYNADDRAFCVDCSEKLDKPVSAGEEERLKKGIGAKMEKLYNDKDPFGITLFDKVCGTVCAVGLVATLILFLVALFTQQSREWYLLSFVFLLLGMLDAFVPKLLWALELWRLSFTISNPEEAVPSGFYLFFRRAGIALTTVLGVASLFAGFITKTS